MGAGHKAKSAIKRAVKLAALEIGRFRRFNRHRPPVPCARILTYHSVGQRLHDMNVSPGFFRAQMEWLARNGDVITLEEAAQGRPGVAITFDDGYRDNLVNAAPVLQELGISATVFVVAGCVGGLLDHDNDPVASALMDWTELAAIEKAGVTIGAHTMTHPRLAGLDEDTQRAEIFGCAHLLEERLGHPVSAFAYPFGSAMDYNETTKRLVRAAGFSLAVTNRYGTNPPGAEPWELRRIWIDTSDTIEMFRAKVQGRLDLLSILDTNLGLRARRLLNRLLKT